MGQIDASPAVKSLESNAEQTKLAASVKEANKKFCAENPTVLLISFGS